MAERLRERTAEKRVMFRNSPIKLTVSVGVAHVDPAGDAIEAPDLLERADQALYRAKASGRDAVWYWDPAVQKPMPAAPEARAALMAASADPVQVGPTSISAR